MTSSYRKPLILITQNCVSKNYNIFSLPANRTSLSWKRFASPFSLIKCKIDLGLCESSIKEVHNNTHFTIIFFSSQENHW